MSGKKAPGRRETENPADQQKADSPELHTDSDNSLAGLIQELGRHPIKESPICAELFDATWPALRFLPPNIKRWLNGAVEISMGNRTRSTVEKWQGDYRDTIRPQIPEDQRRRIDELNARILAASKDDEIDIQFAHTFGPANEHTQTDGHRMDELRDATDGLMESMRPLAFCFTDDLDRAGVEIDEGATANPEGSLKAKGDEPSEGKSAVQGYENSESSLPRPNLINLELHLDERDILVALHQAGGPIRYAPIMEETGLNRGQVFRALQSLREKHQPALVQHHPPRKGFSLTGPGEAVSREIITRRNLQGT